MGGTYKRTGVNWRIRKRKKQSKFEPLSTTKYKRSSPLECYLWPIVFSFAISPVEASREKYFYFQFQFYE